MSQMFLCQSNQLQKQINIYIEFIPSKRNINMKISLTGLCNNQILKQVKKILQQRPVAQFKVFVKYKNSSSKDENCIPEEKEKQQSQQGTIEQIVKKSLEQKQVQQQKKSLLEEGIQDYSNRSFNIAIDKLQKIKESIEMRIDKKQQTAKDLQQYPRATLYLGNCYFQLKNYDLAIENYSQEQGENIKQKGQRMNNLGTCYALKNQNQLSLKAFNEALRCYSQHPQVDCSKLLNNIAFIYKKSGMLKMAEYYFKQSIRQREAKSPQDHQMLFKTYFQIGLCQRELTNYFDSLKNYESAFRLAKEGKDDNILNVLKQIARVYELQQNWDEALNKYEKLSDQCEKKKIPQGYIYQRVAKIHEKRGNYPASQIFNKKALQEYRKQGNERKTSQLSGNIKLSVQNANIP